MSLPVAKNLSKEEINKIYTDFMDSFQEGISISNLTNAVTTLMRMVGSYKKMGGLEKKHFVVDMLIFCVTTSNEDTNNILDTLSPFIIHNVPLMIDALINVEQGKIIFNPATKKCFLSALSCLNTA